MVVWSKGLAWVRKVAPGTVGAVEGLVRARRTAAHFAGVVRLAERAGPAADLRHGGPFISFVVPVYNTDPCYLSDLLASFREQDGPFCELILSDDGSTAPQTLAWLDAHAGDAGVAVVRSGRNQGIAGATNTGLARATGKWVGLVDHDDALAPHAIRRIAAALAAAPDCAFLYTDEVIADAKLRPVDYFLKPAWDPVLLSGVNYINHLSLYRRDRLLATGGLREGFNGSQDYDLVLRYTKGLRDDEILHLPYPAYLWRRHDDSYSTQFLNVATANARKALTAHYDAPGRPVAILPAVAKDLHRVRFDSDTAAAPLVSVVIPNRDAYPLIAKLLDGLRATAYPALEIIVIDNGSTDAQVLALYDACRAGPIPFRAEIVARPFNFSQAVNDGIALAHGDYVLLLNNDIEILEPDWLTEMVSCFNYARTGIVGAKLLYPDGSLQHAGVIAGLGELAGHWFIGQPHDYPGPMGRLWVRQSLSAVTGACFLVSRACLEQVGRFDDTAFKIAYNDIDFCLRAQSAGFRVVWTPFAKLVHHESASRGSDETPENIGRFRHEQKLLRERHRTDLFQDRAFNPWYSRDRSLPRPIPLTELPPAR